MARKKPAPNSQNLFEESERILDRRIRRQRALFIPRFVREEAGKTDVDVAARDRAHAIAVRWADLEKKSGRVHGDKETSIDTRFLDELFGEGLGHRLKSTDPTWELEHKKPVKGVGIADAALGHFPARATPQAVIELKGASIDLDRDRSNGRTAVQQCWDYLNALPDCQWGIVSNFRSIRLYHKSRGVLAFEEYTLQELRDQATFCDFYAIFSHGGLLPSRSQQPPRAELLLQKTADRQKTVGDDLYRQYHSQRLLLIEHLHKAEGKDLDEAIRIAQKLLDRIIFIAFCEDRGLLPAQTLRDTIKETDLYSRAKNPAWDNFLKLFTAIDRGVESDRVTITAFNGGLFADDPAINALDLEQKRWTHGFAGFGKYDFTEEVNVDVLGHLFERSITELEKLRVGGLFALKANALESPFSKMPKSTQRKRFGIYYTPPAFTGLIVERTVDALIRERFSESSKKLRIDPEQRGNANDKKLLAHWRACWKLLETITVVDPACGSGAFLIRAYDTLEAWYLTVIHGLASAGEADDAVAALAEEIPDRILRHNLFGVDLSREGVEITQLVLWIRSARVGRTLADLSNNIIHANSLVADPAVDAHAMDWRQRFPKVFERGGFDCVIGNPPWERVKVQDREFFSLTDPETAGAVSAADRKKRIGRMETANPELHANYLKARDHAQKLLDYARAGDYPLTGKGDVNLYMLFAELAGKLVAPLGIAGLLVPSGIATDDTTKEFFSDLVDHQRLISLYDFENRDKVFEDVDSRFKFTALIYSGAKHRTEQADFVFFARSVEETAESNKQRHIVLTAKDMALLNPNTKTCPIFRTRRDAELTKGIYERVPILIDEQRRSGGNPWGIQFFTMLHQTNDAKHFHPLKVWKQRGYELRGNVQVKGKRRGLPLYEAKMVQAFDHRAASVIVDENNWVRQGQKEETTLVEHQNPEFGPLPRWWVSEEVVAELAKEKGREWLYAYKDITSATNERTMIASFMPWVEVVNSAPLVIVGESIPARLEACLLANQNSFVFDFVARQKVGGVHLNFFIVEQLPTLPPATYADKCRWSKRETLEHWISERVLKLSCTAEDMLPLARACGFKGSRGDGVHIWKEVERAELRVELDAAFFHLYGIERDDVEYILSTFTNTGFQGEADEYLWPPRSTGGRILEFYDRLRG